LPNRVHSLRISYTEADYGAGALAASAREGFALVADRDFPVEEAPAIYSLYANAGVPKGPAPEEFSLTVDKQPATAELRRWRWPYRALAAALVVHLAVIALFIARPGQPKRLGVENGLPEHLNVSVISSDDLRRLSSDPFRQDANPLPAPESETPPSPPQPQVNPAPPQPPMQPAASQPPVQEASAAFSPSKSKPAETRDYDPSGFIEMASAQFSAQLNQAFKAAEARREAQQRPAQPAQQASLAARNVKVFRPGASHTGKSDEFARAVIWALAATKPMGNGKWGSVIVTFVVENGGRLEGPRMLKSSGDNWLDTAALMSVRQARMPAPPPGLPPGDRTFNVEYISLQER